MNVSATAPPGAFDWSVMLTPAIIALVPLIIAYAKRWIPDRYTALLPVLAAALGPSLDYVAAWLLAQPASPGRGVMMGMAGVALREIIDQLRKVQTGPTVKAGVVLLAGLLATGCATPMACFDRAQAGYVLGTLSAGVRAKCSAQKLSELECARLAEIEAAAARTILAPPGDTPDIDTEALLRFLVGAAKLAI